MSHVSPKKQGWIPCEFAAMHDCNNSDDEEFCRTYKDPGDCEKYHRKMVLEGEETAEEFKTWQRNRVLHYYSGRRYSHASKEDPEQAGQKTLCGMSVGFANHNDGRIWNEITKEGFEYNPCPKCKQLAVSVNTNITGKQVTL